MVRVRVRLRDDVRGVDGRRIGTMGKRRHQEAGEQVVWDLWVILEQERCVVRLVTNSPGSAREVKSRIETFEESVEHQRKKTTL